MVGICRQAIIIVMAMMMTTTKGSCYHDCHFTPFINDFDNPMDYTVQVLDNFFIMIKI